MELTKKEFEQILDQKFDQKLKPLASKADLKGFVTKVDLNVGLKSLKDEMQQFTKNEVDHLATMVKDGFDELADKLDVRERVTTLEKNYGKIKKALYLE